MFTPFDQQMMSRALEIAALGRYSAPPNPAVGCVIAQGEKIVGEGWHRKAGERHAEPIALEMAGAAAKNSTAYVTLEPHSFHSRTPPCTDALIKAGVRRVVIGMIDPNPKVSGQGVEQLRAAGIEVEVGLMESAARELNRGFAKRMESGLPWCTLKVGASLDGRVALANGESRWITGPEARADVQRLRAQSSAIVTGVGTVLADDPQLTVRDAKFEMYGRVPLRVVCDSHLKTPPTARLLRESGSTLIVHTQAADRTEALKRAGTKLLRIDGDSAGRVPLQTLMRELGKLECNEILIEAGPTLSGAWLASGLLDELVVYQAPVVLGSSARPMFETPDLERLEDRWQFTLIESRAAGSDQRLTLRPQRK
jgi:diaminohydroxyphosphoribosylaminopyrimidine deaminase/5-amino-6-(5-phosphoribosylamino)uracil reductase